MFAFTSSVSLLIGVYTVRSGRFWRGFLHHTYRTALHFWKVKTSLHKVRLNLSGSMLFVRLHSGRAIVENGDEKEINW